MNLAGLRVLVVDGNPTNREILHHQLDAWKMRDSAVSNDGEALPALLEAAAVGDPFQLAIEPHERPDC